MAEIQNSFFYDGEQQYGEDELGIVFDTCFRSGVRVDDSGNMCYKVTANHMSGSVTVDPGEALVGGRWRYDNSPQTLETTAASTNRRRDRVVIRTDYANKKTFLAIKQGTASSNPQPPALQQDKTYYEISLATIEVSTTNHVELISDDRPNTALCGAVRARGPSEINEQIAFMGSQFDSLKTNFEAWFNQQQGEKGWRNIYLDSVSPQKPVAGSLVIDIGTYFDMFGYADDNGDYQELFLARSQFATKEFYTPFMTLNKNSVTSDTNIHWDGWYPLGIMEMQTQNTAGGYNEEYCTIYRYRLRDQETLNATANFAVHDHFGRAKIKVRFVVLYVRSKH